MLFLLQYLRLVVYPGDDVVLAKVLDPESSMGQYKTSL